MTPLNSYMERLLPELDSKSLVCMLVTALLFLSALVIPVSASQRMVLAEGYTNYT